MMTGTANVNNLPDWYLLFTLLFLAGISVYDIYHHKIRNVALLLFLIWCILAIPLRQSGEPAFLFSNIMKSLAGFFWGSFIFLAVSSIPGCRIGGGDIKLAALLGILTGTQGILVISFFSAAYASLYLLLKHPKARRPIPYAPFILFGTITLLTIWRYQ